MPCVDVVHLVWGLEPGGIQRSIASLARHSPAGAVRHRVVGMHTGGAARRDLEEAGCEVVELDKKPGIDPACYGRLCRLLRSAPTAMLHMHDPTACFWGVPAARAAGVPARLATLHTLVRAVPWPKRRLFLHHLRRMDRVVVLSRTARARLLEHGPFNGDVVVCPLGPESGQRNRTRDRQRVRRDMGIADDAVVLLTCARLEREKNLAWLVGPAKTLAGADGRVVFVVAGEGSRRRQIERLVRRADLGDRFRLPGYIPALLSASDVFVLPSLVEELPVSVLEAMAAGLPVVASPVGSLPEVITGEAGTGFTVPTSDTAGWLSCLRRLVENAELRRELGNRGRRLISRRFDIRRNAADMAALYRSLQGGVRE
ncbi:glycosyltransferase [Verrucomicrobiota bacterium]